MSDTVTAYTWTMLNLTHEDLNSTEWELFVKNDIGNTTITGKLYFGELLNVLGKKQLSKAKNLLITRLYNNTKLSYAVKSKNRNKIA
jgi:hypothetical protein